MSLTYFVKLKDVADRLRPFRPPLSRVSVPLKVAPVHDSPQLTGTAFDYLLRFELQRRAPHARHREWIAEKVPALVAPPRSGGESYRDYLWGNKSVEYIPPDELAEQIEKVCAEARAAVTAHAAVSNPSPESMRDLATWAVRLAKLDGVYRRDEFDPTFQEAPINLTEELVALLDAVPFDRLIHPDRMELNPNFGEVSALVSGADADLITGDLLLDFKTTRSFQIREEHVDQLFGYFLLARRAGLPEINRVGFYFSRFGETRIRKTSLWTGCPDFEETERWFFERAAKEFANNRAPVISSSASRSAPGTL